MGVQKKKGAVPVSDLSGDGDDDARSSTGRMFSTLGLLQSLPCPRRPDCPTPTLCPFSHAPHVALHPQLIATPAPPRTVPAKRPLELTASTSRPEPPPQRLRTASTPNPVVLPARPQSSVRPLRSSRFHRLTLQTRVDRCARPQSQCRTVAGGLACPPGP